MDGAPRLLLIAATWWPSLAVLGDAFEAAGFAVVLLCPKGHVAFAARRFACRELDRRDPERSVAQALHAVDPALVVPGDERVVRFLRRLHAADPRWRALIERAIGGPSSHPVLTARVPLLEAAPAAGFTVPQTRALECAGDLEDWLRRVPPPWVLKVDGGWGGEGVRVATDPAAARHAFRQLRRGVPFGLALRRMLVNGDPFLWQDRRAGFAPAVSAQAFVTGRPGNCAVFALGGRLLGATVVEAMETSGERGPSILVRAVDRPDIVEGARRLVAQLGLSGFIGFDVLIDGAGTALLIEMNPRITMPCRMQGPFGPAPIIAAAMAYGAVPRSPAPSKPRNLFASFPLAWLADPFAPALAACTDDLPLREPAMLRDSLRPLWPERGLLATLPARARAWKDRLRGRARPDYRRRSPAWWMEQGGLAAAGVPPVQPGAEQARAAAGRSAEFRPAEADPRQA